MRGWGKSDPVVAVRVLPIHEPKGGEAFDVFEEEWVEWLCLVRGEEPRHYQADIANRVHLVCLAND